MAATWHGPAGRGEAFRCEALERGHAERLIPMVGAVMADAPFDFDALGRIVVTVGPGTFTGQRVGIAAARALALATGAPVVSLSSLAVLAATAAAALGGQADADAEGQVLAVAVDARRGEIYFQSFAGPVRTAREAPLLATPEEAVRRLQGARVIAVGSGAVALAQAGAAAGVAITASLPALQPDIRYFSEVAVDPSAGPPRPLYLRPPDAKPQAGASLARLP